MKMKLQSHASYENIILLKEKHYDRGKRYECHFLSDLKNID